MKPDSGSIYKYVKLDLWFSCEICFSSFQNLMQPWVSNINYFHEKSKETNFGITRAVTGPGKAGIA